MQFASATGGRGLGDLRLLHRSGRGGTRAAVAEVEPVAAQLVAPVLALERPQLLVVVDLRRRPALRDRRRGGRRRGQLLLAAGDLEIEAQRLAEQLAQFAPLARQRAPRAFAGTLQQV